ncbi:putative ribonuclease H-like domain-containing protein [Tanacetum coccineum]
MKSCPVARIEAIRLFLAYASFKDFVVYQMDVKSAFLYGKIEEEVYVCQPPGFEDPNFPDRVYKVKKAQYGLHQAPKLVIKPVNILIGPMGFKEGKLTRPYSSKGYKLKQKKDGIFISQDKYVAEILKKFGFIEVKTASTPMETQNPLLKDEDGEEVDDPFISKDSPFDLVAYTDSDYAGASLDRKSTTRDYEEIDGGYVAFRGNPKEGKSHEKYPKCSHDDGSKPSSDVRKKVYEDPREESVSKDQEKADNVNSTNKVNIVSSTVNDAGTNEVNAVGGNMSIELPFDSKNACFGR